MTFEEALKGTLAPEEVIKTLSLVDVPFIDFDSNENTGQIVIASDLKDDVVEIFTILHENKFPIRSIVPIVEFNWVDHASIAENNTSAFNYRNIAGTDRLSNHSFGRAIDINPALNPYFDGEGNSRPPGYTYELDRPGTIQEGDIVVKAFLDRGWTWGGHWTSIKDYQHFEKK